MQPTPTALIVPSMVPLGRAFCVNEQKNLWREAFAWETKQVGEEKDRTIRFQGSTEAVDREGDVVIQKGGDVRNYRRNPAVLWAHSSGGLFSTALPPIGTAEITLGEKGWIFDVKFARPESFAFADTIYRLSQDKVIRAGSIGFIPRETARRTDENGEQLARGLEFRKWELVEFSIVPIGMNHEALQDAKARGLLDAGEVKQLSHALEDLEEIARGLGLLPDLPAAGPELPGVLREGPPLLSVHDFEDFASRLQRGVDQRLEKVLEQLGQIQDAQRLADVRVRDFIAEIRETDPERPAEPAQPSTASEDPPEGRAASSAPSQEEIELIDQLEGVFR